MNCVELIASNDHLELQMQINAWLRIKRPRRTRFYFVADGAEFTYCVLIVYAPREKPLPKYKS